MKTTRTILTTMLVAAIALDAAGANWTNTGSGDWFSPSNWSDTAVPTSSSDCINDVGTILIFSGTDAVAQRLILGNSVGSSGSLNMTGGSFSGRVNIGLRGNGSMTVSGGRVFSSNYCALGLYPESTGSLTITGDGVWEVTSHGLMVVQAGTGTVTIANGGELIQSSTLTVVQPYQIDGVSRFGKGTLRVENGGKLTVPNVNLGGLNARFILDGGLFVSAATASGNLVYGVYATGALEIGPRGGTISVAGGTQSVVVDLDNLAESYGGALSFSAPSFRPAPKRRGPERMPIPRRRTRLPRNRARRTNRRRLQSPPKSQLRRRSDLKPATTAASRSPFSPTCTNPMNSIRTC